MKQDLRIFSMKYFLVCEGKVIPALPSCHEDILREWRHSSMHSLTSALDGGEWSISHPGCFTPLE